MHVKAKPFLSPLTLMSLAAVSILAYSSLAIAGEASKPVAPQPEAAPVAETFGEAFTKGKFNFNLRYRYESVGQTGFAREAVANTARIQLGFTTGPFYGFVGNLEFEGVGSLGDDNFNDTVNGHVAFPIIADPEAAEINTAFIRYQGIPDTKITIGRQRLNLDNQRFVGTVAWRQNEQTFDGYTVENSSIPGLKLLYNYTYDVDRVFGDDSPVGDFKSHAHIINANYTGLPQIGMVGTYAYLLDFLNAPASSSSTYGGSIDGNRPFFETGAKLLYRAEYARQSDYQNNPTPYDADYIHLVGGVGFKDFIIKAAYEKLGSDGGSASFQTPLATLHAFNGWADKFLTTPANGLVDTYALVSYSPKSLNIAWLEDTTFSFRYDDYNADFGSAHYGNEWGISAEKTFMKNFTIGIKYADYNADTLATDTQKFWVWLSAKY